MAHMVAWLEGTEELLNGLRIERKLALGCERAFYGWAWCVFMENCMYKPFVKP